MAYMLLLVKPYLFRKAMSRSMNTAVSQLVQAFRDKHKIATNFDSIALDWFIPAAELIYTHQLRAKSPFFIGINGSQGSGKSTFTDFIQSYLSTLHNLNVAVISLDDFYYPKKVRNALAQEIHPLMVTRGVPGTHDTNLMQSVLAKLKRGEHTKLPRFNKATDEPHPDPHWPEVVEPVDIVILEGWCWGVMPQNKYQLAKPINKLEHNEDDQAHWRTYVNQQLATEYQPLYSIFDFWLMLQAPSFNCVTTWRKEQEHKLRAATTSSLNSGVMSDQQIERFVQHYQRLTEQSLETLPLNADLVFQLDQHRSITSVTGNSKTDFQRIKQLRGEKC